MSQTEMQWFVDLVKHILNDNINNEDKIWATYITCKNCELF